ALTRQANLLCADSQRRCVTNWRAAMWASPAFIRGGRTHIAHRSRIGAGASASTREKNIARFEKLARTSPETAAARILRGVECNEPRILIGMDAYQIDILQRLRPTTYWKTLSRRFEQLAAKAR